MNEYERSECYGLLRKIINWNSMLRDNQGDTDELISYLRGLEERQRSKYYQVLNEESESLRDEDEF